MWMAFRPIRIGEGQRSRGGVADAHFDLTAQNLLCSEALSLRGFARFRSVQGACRD